MGVELFGGSCLVIGSCCWLPGAWCWLHYQIKNSIRLIFEYLYSFISQLFNWKLAASSQQPELFNRLLGLYQKKQGCNFCTPAVS